jgi:hypothetical protein
MYVDIARDGEEIVFAPASIQRTVDTDPGIKGVALVCTQTSIIRGGRAFTPLPSKKKKCTSVP